MNVLDGIRVIDLSQFAAGPVATLAMAQMGAEVIKIERPGVGEQGRLGEGQNRYWALQHGNKKSVTLDLKSDEGKEILTRFIELGDVLIENYAPGMMEKLGFSWERIHEINPRCIYAQIKGYAPNSPYAKYPAMDGTVQCTGGMASQTGQPGGIPALSNVTVADDPAGRAALTGILAALYGREKTGRGEHVEIFMQEIAMSICKSSYALGDSGLVRGKPMAYAGDMSTPRGVFACKPRSDTDQDNYIFLMVNDMPGQKMWKNSCKAIGHLELIEDPRFIDGYKRFDNVAELNPYIDEWAAQYDKVEAMEILCANGVPAGAVLGPKDLLASQDLYESGFLQKINHPHPNVGEIVIQNSPYHISGTHVDHVPSADLGQHNQEVYAGVLGLSADEIASLQEKGVI